LNDLTGGIKLEFYLRETHDNMEELLRVFYRFRQPPDDQIRSTYQNKVGKKTF